jgi:hypothetical protein
MFMFMFRVLLGPLRRPPWTASVHFRDSYPLAPKLQHSLSAVTLGIYLGGWKVTTMKNFFYIVLKKIVKFTSLSSTKTYHPKRNSKNACLSVGVVKAIYGQAFILPVEDSRL